jgi:hypothetical protein
MNHELPDTVVAEEDAQLGIEDADKHLLQPVRDMMKEASRMRCQTCTLTPSLFGEYLPSRYLLPR